MVGFLISFLVIGLIIGGVLTTHVDEDEYVNSKNSYIGVKCTQKKECSDKGSYKCDTCAYNIQQEVKSYYKKK